MAKGEILGLMVCPECEEEGAQIKRAKSGLLYRWCAKGCNAQFFARNADQEYAMAAHLFPKAEAVPAVKPAMPVPTPGMTAEISRQAAPDAIQPKPAKRGFDMGAL